MQLMTLPLAWLRTVALLALCRAQTRLVAAWVNNWDDPLDFSCESGGVYSVAVSCRFGVYAGGCCEGGGVLNLGQVDPVFSCCMLHRTCAS